MGAVSTKITEHNLEADVDRRARARAYSASPSGQRALRSRRMQRWQRTQHKQRARGSAARAAQEADPSRGERVWVARCIAGGTLRFWAVLAGGARLEISRVGEAPVGAGEGVFSATAGPGDVGAERARVAGTETGDGDLDGYYVALVGWADRSGAACAAMLADLASNVQGATLSRADAQALLGRAADTLVGRRRALDFAWVAADAEVRRTRDRWLAAPPVEMLQRVLDTVFGGAVGGAVGAAARREGERIAGRGAQIDQLAFRQAHTQMQSQVNARIHDQVQMQMQAQIQSQINMSIQASALASSSAGGAATSGGAGSGGGL